MESTTDYRIFKKSASNRELDVPNLRRIIASIKVKNLLDLRPIMVNSNMEVIDGQHRLEAAKILSVPIYYTIKRDSSHEDILLLNLNQKGWGMEDFLKYFISLGCVEYHKFESFMKSQRLNFKETITFLRCAGKCSYNQFKAGTFVFPEGIEFMSIMDLKTKFDEIVTFIVSQKIEGSKICCKANFKIALLEFLRSEDVDFDIFKKKLSINMDKIRLCSGPASYLMMLRDIYNWKNRDPITF
jgi:ParB-like nuclease domain